MRRKAHPMSVPHTSRRISRILTYLAVIFMLACMLSPLFWLLRVSLDENLFDHPAALWPPADSIGFSAYRTVFGEPYVINWYLNSIYVTGLTLLVTIPISTMAGYALSRYRRKETVAISGLILLARMLPMSLLVIPLYVLFSKIGILNNPICLVLANTTFAIPFCVWLLKGFFDALPTELEEAAEVDGCGLWGSFLRITLPLALPGIAAAATYLSVVSWSEYIFARTFMTHPRTWTLAVGAIAFRQQYLANWNTIAAASLVFMVPLLILFAFLQRYLVQGLSAGAVKG